MPSKDVGELIAVMLGLGVYFLMIIPKQPVVLAQEQAPGPSKQFPSDKSPDKGKTNATVKQKIIYDVAKCIIEVGPGEGDIINLSPLARRDGYPRFHDSHSVPIPDFNVEENYNFSFNPCVVYSLPKNSPHDCYGDGCHSAILCKGKQEDKDCHFLTLGYHSKGTMEVEVGVKPNSDTTFSLVYTGLGSQRFTKTVVKLICDKNRTKLDEALFQVLVDNGMGLVITELRHECCCVGGCWNAGLGKVNGTDSNASGSSEKVLVLVGAFVGMVLMVLLIAVMCYVKKTHMQFYSKLPGVNPNSSNTSDPTNSRKGSLMISGKDRDLRDYEPNGPSSGRLKALPVLENCVIPFQTVEMQQRLGGNPFGDTHLGMWKEMTMTVKRLTLSIHDNQLTHDTMDWMKKEIAHIRNSKRFNIADFK